MPIMHPQALHREIALAKLALEQQLAERHPLLELRLELVELGLADKPRRQLSKREKAKADRKAARLELVGQEYDPCTEHCEPGYQCPARYRYALDQLDARIARRRDPEPQLVMDPDEGWSWRY